MLINLLLIILISNAIATNYNKSVQYSRLAILGLLSITVIIYSNTYIISLENSIGLYNGLFNISVLSQSFNIFILILSSIISVLTAFYPRKLYNYLGIKELNLDNKSIISNNKDLYISGPGASKNGFQFTIIEYSLITLFILSGAILLISAGDLVSLFLSIELQSYGLYILATIYRNSESATGSGLTYFLLGGLSSCFILLGSAILYVNSGITNLDNIYILNSINEVLTYNSDSIMASILSENIHEDKAFVGIWDTGEGLNYINFSLIILMVGLLFKISAAPFHFWSPDVYDGIPTIVTTFVAIVAKISLLILILELVTSSSINTSNVLVTTELDSSYIQSSSYIKNGSYWGLNNILILSSLMSLFIGSLLGLTQYRIKRLFAYSTISHVGFILLALSINKIESIQAYLFYILQYSVCNLNAFFILIGIGYSLYKYKYNYNIYSELGNKENIKSHSGSQSALTSSNKHSGILSKFNNKFIDIENSPVQLLSQIKGYFHINSFLSVSFAITLFSFVGIPPLIGFFAKQMVLSAALDEGYIFMTLVAVLTSVIGAAYYLNVVKLIFFSKSDYSILTKRNVSLSENLVIVGINDKLSIIISILTMLILFFIFMPDEWFRIVNILSLSINK